MTSNAEESLATLLRWEKLDHGMQREYPFAKSIGRRWRFDFCWEIPKVYTSRTQEDVAAFKGQMIRLAVEVEGGSWVAGAHTRGRHFESDCTKYNAAALMGWTVLRVTPAMIEDGRAVAWIREGLNRGKVAA